MAHKKRGRPPLKLVKNDQGTEELRIKKNLGITTELPDLLLKKNLISLTEHQAALHFRWLHAIKFGIRSLISPYSDAFHEFSFSRHDEAWKGKREEEYNSALKILEKGGARKMVIEICVFGQRTAFINLAESHTRLNKEFQLVKTGLALLADEWRFSSVSPHPTKQRINFKQQVQKALSD